MTNHLHLIIEVADIPFSRILQQLNLRYTKWINYTQDRSGHLFQGRFKALLLDATPSGLNLYAMSTVNPVRAGMTAAPEDHP